MEKANLNTAYKSEGSRGCKEESIDLSLTNENLRTTKHGAVKSDSSLLS